MTGISGPRDQPAQRLSETRAEYFERTGFDAPITPASVGKAPIKSPKESQGISFSEWMLGLGGALFVVGGLLISAAASSSASASGGYNSVGASLGWQTVGSALAVFGGAMLLILVSIHAAVSVWMRNRA